MSTPKRLDSEKVVVQAPMSFVGSYRRTMKLLWTADGIGQPIVRAVVKALLLVVAISVLVVWWALIVCWYVLFGILLIPYRLLRRGSRKRKQEERRHRELMAEMERQRVEQ